MERQQIVERAEFDYDDKLKMGDKSNNRCCHCGKKCYPGYGATVEHFIPISQGGTNNKENMIMLCEACNKEKSNKIYEPTMYLKYLDKEHLDKLEGYFDSYIRSFEFFKYRNVLACDQYTFSLIKYFNSYKSKKITKDSWKKMREISIKVHIKRAIEDDVEKIEAYYIKYLKKREMLDSEEAAKININFWMKYGCIYYVEHNKEISAICPIILCKHSSGDLIYSLKEMPMPYYNTELAYNASNLVALEIPRLICKEHDLPYIPVEVVGLVNEKFMSFFHNYTSTLDVTSSEVLMGLTQLMYIEGDCEAVKTDTAMAKYNKFFEALDNSQVDTEEWYKVHSFKDFDWLLDYLKADYGFELKDEKIVYVLPEGKKWKDGTRRELRLPVNKVVEHGA